jgi:hypothetical protein
LSPYKRLAALAETSTRPTSQKAQFLSRMTTKEEPHAKPLLRLPLFASVITGDKLLRFF